MLEVVGDREVKISIFILQKRPQISFFLILFFNFTILYWFCHISTWIHRRYTHVPHPEPSSLLPPHTIPLGRPSAPAPSIQYHASNLDWRLISYMILYMLQCHSPKSSHRLPLPQSPKDWRIYMEFRKMVTITLYTRQQKRHWCIEQSFGLCERGRGWDDLGEWHWNMYNIIYETSRQSRFDVRYWMLGAGALGRPRGMVWGGRREEGSGWGTHVYLWQIHFDIWILNCS